MNKTHRAALLAAALALCGTAHAEFIVGPGTARTDQGNQNQGPAIKGPAIKSTAIKSTAINLPPASVPLRSPAVHAIGPAPGTPPHAEGWANDVPVSLALRQVVPAGWTVRLEKAGSRSVDEARLVSWKGGRAWPSVLSDLARAGHFEATIRWSEKLVVVCPEPLAAPPPTILSGMGTAGVAKVDPVRKAAPRPAINPIPRLDAPRQGVALPRIALAPVLQWRLDPKRTLRENVEDWTRQAGWNKVVWEAADYPIAAPATFTGDFTSSTGPLATLIGAYDTSDQPLLVELTTMDKVVHVTNRNYRPVVVEPQTAQQFDPPSFKENRAGPRPAVRP